MPFTFSHPTYAFPLKRISPNHLSLTGLILGSMGPDFEYFLLLEPYRSIGHTISGLFIQVIPLSLIFAFIFHYVVKESLAIHLPSLCHMDQRAYHMLGDWKLNSYRSWIVFITSVIIGFISHIIVDSFTHANGFFVNQMAFLEETSIYGLPSYKMLQYGSSLFGLLYAFAVIVIAMYKVNPISTKKPSVTLGRKLIFWLFALAVLVVTTVVKLTFAGSQNPVGILIVAPISGGCLGLILASLCSRLVPKKNRLL